MSEGVQRDILLAVKSSAELSQIDAAIAKLKDLETVATKLRNIMSRPLQVGAIGSDVVSAAKKQLGEVEVGSKGATAAMKSMEQQLGTNLKLLREVRSVSAKGDEVIKQTFSGPTEAITTKLSSTGAFSVTKDFVKDEAEKLRPYREFKERIQSAMKAEQQAQKQAQAFNIQGFQQVTSSLLKQESADEKQRIKDARDAFNRDWNEAIREDRFRTQQRVNARKQGLMQIQADEIEAQRRTQALNKSFANRLMQTPGAITSQTRSFDPNIGGYNTITTMYDKATGATYKFNQATGQLSSSITQTGDNIFKAAGKVAMWSIATGAVFGSVAAVKSMVTTFTELEAVQNKLSRIGRGFGATDTEMAAGAARVTNEIMRLKVEFGSVGDEAGKAAIVFARLGMNERQVTTAVRTSLMAANVAGIGAEESAKLLAASMQQFGKSASDLPDMLNKLNVMENNTRVETIDLLNAMSRAGGVFREAGGSFEQLAAITAVVAQGTGRTGAEIGNAFKTISSNIVTANTQAKVFATTGIGIENVKGQMIPFNDLLGKLVTKFYELSEAERNEVALSIAGVRQRNILQSALDNYWQIQAQVIRQYQDSSSAQKEQALIMDTLSKKWEQLVAAFESFSKTVMSSGIGDILKLIVDSVRSLLNGLSELGLAGGVIFITMAAQLARIIAHMAGFKLLTGSIKETAAARSADAIAANQQSMAMATNDAAKTTQIEVNKALAASEREVALARSGGAWAVGAGTRTPGVPVGNAAAGAAGLAGLLGNPWVVAGTAAVAVGTTLYGAAKSMQKDDIRDQNDLLERQAKLTENRNLADRKSAETLQSMSTALRALEGPNVTAATAAAERNKIHKAMQDILRNEPDLLAQIASGEISSAKAAALAAEMRKRGLTSTADLEKAYQTQAYAQDQKEVAMRNRRREIDKEIREHQETARRVAGGGTETAGSALEHWNAVKELEDEKKRLNVEIAESQVKAQELHSKYQNLRNRDKAEAESAQVQPQLDQADEELKKFESRTRLKLRLDAGMAVNDVDRAQREIDTLTQAQKDLNALAMKYGPALAKESAEGKVAKAFDDAIAKYNEKLEAAQGDEKSANQQKNLKDVEDRIKGDEKVFRARAKAIASMSGGSGKGEDMVETASELARENAAYLSYLRQQEYVLNGQVGEETRLAETTKARLAMEKIVGLDDLNMQEAKWKALQRQNDERKKSAENLQKELGMMSNSDLMKARIMMGQAASGTLKRLTATEFYNLPQEDRAMYQKIAPGFVPNLTMGLPASIFTKGGSDQYAQPLTRSEVANMIKNVGAHPTPDAPQTASFAPAGAMNVKVNLGGIDTKADQLASGIAMEVRNVIQQIIDENVSRFDVVKSTKPSGFKGAPRSR